MSKHLRLTLVRVGYTLYVVACAEVAQMVEQLIRNQWVGCSIHLFGIFSVSVYG